MLRVSRFRAAVQKFEKPLLVLAGSACLTSILLNLDFNLLEGKLYDLRMSRGIQAAPNPDIALISLDDGTTKVLDEFSPLPLDLHAQFLEALEKLEPRAVGYLINLNQVNQINPELFQNEWGTRFVQAANRLEAKGSPVLIGTSFDVTGEVLPPYPLSSLPHSLAFIHKDTNVFAEDRITRRALIRLNDKPVFHVELAHRLGLLSDSIRLRGAFQVPEVYGDYFFFRYHGSTVMHPAGAASEIAKNEDRLDDPLPYRRISFIEILRGNLPPGSLRGKIALVGTLSMEDSSDFAFTPYSQAPFVNPKLIVHANILDSIIRNDGILRVPYWINWFVTFTATGIVTAWVLNLTPLYGVFATLGLTFVFIAINHLFFQLKGIWLRESQPLVGIFLSYYLVVPYRLIREYKKRWDYQRKNEVLMQVEELKTNFLSLVTHDLKTPVARIQGLAEVLLRKSSERLIERDRTTLLHIIDSTDELNRFISSILELSKVESNPTRIQLEFKDLNQLIEKSVDGFKAQARSKRIKIATRLEPLFPIRLDSSLISKVINNLVDNAIKYSFSGSEIFVESKENGDWIEISVRDEGIGMTPDECEKLFTRFYRAKNDTTTQVPGTGLGLYLTKYFVEAHRGKVEIESVKDRGSCFRIFLPIQLDEKEIVAEPSEGGAKGLKRSLKAMRWLTGDAAARNEKENGNV